MKPSNLLVLMSDQHNKKITGRYGNSVIARGDVDISPPPGVQINTTKAYERTYT